MPSAMRRLLFAATVAVLTSAAVSLIAQRGTGLTADQVAQRWRTENELAVDRRRRAQGDDADARRRPPGHRHLPSEERVGKVPTIFVRTPYNFNYWDVRERRAARHERRR